MKILLAGPRLLIPWLPYTSAALNRLGQNVSCFYENSLPVDRFLRGAGALGSPAVERPLETLRNRWLQRRDERLLRRARNFRPDLTLILWGRSFSPSFLKTLKETTRTPLVTWWLDNPFDHRVHGQLETYDWRFVFDRTYVEQLRSEGLAQTRFLPCACDETVYRPVALTPRQQRRYRSDIALVAWFYPERAEIVRMLHGMDLKIWGREWRSPEARRSLNGTAAGALQPEGFYPDWKTCLIYNACKVGLNIHADQTRRGGLNARAFELLSCGAFELTDRVPGMEELLEPDREVATYRSAGEAREKASYYLRHPEEARRMAGEGRRRVLNQHTYFHRMRSLLGTVKGAL